MFSRRNAPRELSGTVSADPSGLRSVRLSILRRREREVLDLPRHDGALQAPRCGGKWYFRIGDRAEWSYLLPRKLPKGRYTIGVMAVDKAFNESRTTVGIRVRVRRALLASLVAALGVALGAAPAEAARTVQVMVVGKASVLAGPQKVEADGAHGGGRAASAARPARARRSPRWRRRSCRCTFKDYGACSRAARRVRLALRALDRRRAGAAARTAGSTRSAAASDPPAPPTRPARSATGRRLRSGQKVLWFWCVKDAGGRLPAHARGRRAADRRARCAPFPATVRGYDENGGGVPVAGVEVAPGAVTDASGAATVTAPAAAGTLTLRAEAPGLVQAFPRKVTVG